MDFRDYLLFKEKRWSIVHGKTFAINSIKDLWSIGLDGIFICLHYIFDPILGIVPVPV